MIEKQQRTFADRFEAGGAAPGASGRVPELL
jgi:hypothetical protein